MDRKLALLSKVPLFSSLSGHDLQALGRLVDEVDAPTGKVLAEQGSYGSEFYVVVDGTLSVERDGRHLNDMVAGDWFGELALIAHIPRTATVACTSPCQLLVLGTREFATLRADHPDVEICILRTLAERLTHLEGDRPH